MSLKSTNDRVVVVAGVGADAGMDEILDWLEDHPEVTALNAAHKQI